MRRFAFVESLEVRRLFAGAWADTIDNPYMPLIPGATGAALSWDPNADGTVNAVAVNAGAVYAGGSFTAIGGQARNRIAALDAATGVASSWNPDANSTVRTLVVNGSTVYAGGDFTSLGGQSRNDIAAWRLHQLYIPGTRREGAADRFFSLVAQWQTEGAPDWLYRPG